MKGSRRVFRQPYVYIYLYLCYVYGSFVYSCGTPTFIPLGLNKAHLCLRRQASWLGLQVCLNAVNLNSFFRMFLRVMQWSSHCIPWQIEFVGVLFGLRPRFCVSGLLLFVSLFSLAKRKSGWGICGSSWFGGFVCFLFVVFFFDLPGYRDQRCPCTNVFSTAYTHVRTEP